MIPKFIKTYDNIIFFAFNKVNDKYICIPKMVDDYKGRSYQEWFDEKNVLSKYFSYFDGLGTKVYLVSESNVIETFNPIEYVDEKKYKEEDKSGYVEKIVASINDYFTISKDSIGIEGSHVINKSKDTSDIDVFVYGYDNSKIIQDNFKSFSNYPNIRLFNDLETHLYAVKKRNCGFGNDLESVQNQFNKRYYGFIDKQQFSIVCVPYENKEGYINLNRKLDDNKPFKKKLKVIDDKYSSIIPAIYRCIDDDGNIYTIEMYNHYGINQARNGNYIYVEANEYKNLNENMVVYGFWNKNERFDVLEGSNYESERLLCKKLKKNN